MDQKTHSVSSRGLTTGSKKQFNFKLDPVVKPRGDREKRRTTILSQLPIEKAYYRTNLPKSRLVIIFDN
ncbi:palindromic element RPE4 domain-containing protein [Rickettsia sp.]|uniref:palindromic element RPE4 domain-containing protein n=1 Tax=Rickettsia sp. TaxID=789 RepID=UPI003978A45F